MSGKWKSFSRVWLFCDPLDVVCRGPRLLCPWNSQGKNTGVGSHFFLQGIFRTLGSNPCLLHRGQILYCLSHQGSPRCLELGQFPRTLQWMRSGWGTMKSIAPPVSTWLPNTKDIDLQTPRNSNKSWHQFKIQLHDTLHEVSLNCFSHSWRQDSEESLRRVRSWALQTSCLERQNLGVVKAHSTKQHSGLPFFLSKVIFTGERKLVLQALFIFMHCWNLRSLNYLEWDRNHNCQHKYCCSNQKLYNYSDSRPDLCLVLIPERWCWVYT